MTDKNATPATTVPELRTSHLAKRFGLKPTALRRILRSMPEYADGVHTNYRWKSESDPAIGKIAKAIEAAKVKRAAAKVAAQAALAKAKAEQAASTKPATHRIVREWTPTK